MIMAVKPDSKHRITLGKLAKGVSRFDVTQKDDGRIILVPFVEIPAREKWLFDNKIALGKVKKGLQESAAGKVSSRGSFAKYVRSSSTK